MLQQKRFYERFFFEVDFLVEILHLVTMKEYGYG
jgi:hypothetical protein